MKKEYLQALLEIEKMIYIIANLSGEDISSSKLWESWISLCEYLWEKGIE